MIKTIAMKNINGQVFNVDISNVDNLLARGWTLVTKEKDKKENSNKKLKKEEEIK